MVEDPPSSTLLHFGTGIHLYPYAPKFGSFNHPSSQVLVESLGNILDRLKMYKKASTSRVVSSNTAMAELPATIPTMFVGMPYVLASYQSLRGVHLKAALTTLSTPIYSSRVPSHISYVETQ